MVAIDKRLRRLPVAYGNLRSIIYLWMKRRMRENRRKKKQGMRRFARDAELVAARLMETPARN